MNNRYKNAASFRKALEDRLQALSERERLELQRLRRKVAFNRFLARIFAGKDDWVLKGGYSMELRLAHARSTRDIDLSYGGKAEAAYDKPENFILELLQKIASTDLGDYFMFQIGQLQLKLDAPVYGGARYHVRAMIDGRLFITFHVDVALGDYLPAEVENTIEPELAGICRDSVRANPHAPCRSAVCRKDSRLHCAPLYAQFPR